jgi:uncharacterized RDD family membrane protein YckC
VTGHVSPVPREARPYQGLRAGLPSRVLANVIDAVVVVGILAGTYAVVAAVLFLWRPSSFRIPAPSVTAVLIIGHLVVIAYLALAWSSTGRTYGDQVMGLRVVNRRGERLGLLASLARATFCAIFPLGLAWIAVSRENRSVQDVVLWTSVVYDWQPRAGQPPAISDGAPTSGPRSRGRAAGSPRPTRGSPAA